MIHLSSALGIRAAALLLYDAEAQFKKIRETVESYGYSFLQECDKEVIDPNAYGYEMLIKKGLSEGWTIYGSVGSRYSTTIRHISFAEDLKVLIQHLKNFEQHSLLKYKKWIAEQDKTLPCKYLNPGQVNEINAPDQVYIKPSRCLKVLTVFIFEPITKSVEDVAYIDFTTDPFFGVSKALKRITYLQDRLHEMQYCFRTDSRILPIEFNELVTRVKMICEKPKQIETFHLNEKELFVSKIIEELLDVLPAYHNNSSELLTQCAKKLLPDSDYSEKAEKEYISYLSDRFKGRNTPEFKVTSEFREDVYQLVSQQFQALQTSLSKLKQIKKSNSGPLDVDERKANYYKAITDEVDLSIQLVAGRIQRAIEQHLTREFHIKGYLDQGALTRKGMLYLLCLLGFVKKR